MIQTWNDILRRIESLERLTANLHMGGDIILGNVHALGLISGTFRSGTGIKDVDLTGIQIDADEIVGQAAGADQFYLRAADGKAYFGAGAIRADAAGLKWYEGANQRGQILADGSGWLGASAKFWWTAAGLVYLDGATITGSSIDIASLKNVADQVITALVWPTANQNWATIFIDTNQAFGFILGNNAVLPAYCEWKMPLTAGTWEFKMLHRQGPNDAIVDVDLNGVEKASFDLYGGLTYNVTKTQSNIVISTGGIKTIRLRVDGKNPSSGGYYANVTMIQMRKTA